MMNSAAFTPSAPVLTHGLQRTFITHRDVRHSIWRSSPKIRLLPSPLPRHHLFPKASIAPKDVAVILLAGGTGSRMKADQPKQFLPLAGRAIVDHSIAIFSSLPEVSQLILVVDSSYRHRFTDIANKLGDLLTFADPGKERQDSVYNGFSAVDARANLVCVHDAARPLVTVDCVRQVLSDAREHGAAVLGVPSKATIKESEDGQFVLRTIPRKRLWEIQTPQVIQPALLKRGFDNVQEHNLTVTDDVSIVEYLGEPVKITMGEYTNIKITTPEDMNIAESIMYERATSPLIA